MSYFIAQILLFSLIEMKKLHYPLNINEVDRVVLSINWLPTIVALHNGTKLPDIPNYWTLHGLWPDNNQSKHPEYCKHVPFSYSDIEDLALQLSIKWPSCYVNESIKFWRHEWLKHGSCAIDNLPTINGIHDYFKSALQLYDLYNITKILNENDIIPRNEPYETIVVQNILNRLVGRHVDIEIIKNKSTFFLSAIQICMDKSLNKVDCPDRHIQHSFVYPNPHSISPN